MRLLTMVFIFMSATFLCCLTDAPADTATEEIQVELSTSPDSLIVTLMNESHQSIRVNKRLSNGPDIEPWELNIEVRDMRGQKKDFAAKIEYSFPQKSDWLDLGPQKIVGREISLERIGLYFGLDKGSYDVTASYRTISDDGGVVHTYRSNTVRIKLDTNRDEHIDKLIERGEVHELDLDAFKRRQHSDAAPNQ